MAAYDTLMAAYDTLVEGKARPKDRVVAAEIIPGTTIIPGIQVAVVIQAAVIPVIPADNVIVMDTVGIVARSIYSPCCRSYDQHQQYHCYQQPPLT